MTPARRQDYPAPQHYEFDLFGARTCRACGESQPANSDYFNVDRSRADGLSSQCRRCRAAASSRYYAQKKLRMVAP